MSPNQVIIFYLNENDPTGILNPKNQYPLPLKVSKPYPVCTKSWKMLKTPPIPNSVAPFGLKFTAATFEVIDGPQYFYFAKDQNFVYIHDEILKMLTL